MTGGFTIFIYRQAKEKEHQKAIGLGRGSTKTNGKQEEKLEKEREREMPCEQRPILKQPSQPGQQQRYQCEVSASETDSQREPGVTFQPCEAVTFNKNGNSQTAPNGKLLAGREERADWQSEVKDIAVSHPVGGGGGGGTQQRVRPPVPVRQHTTMCSQSDRKTDSLLRQVELRQWRAGEAGEADK